MATEQENSRADLSDLLTSMGHNAKGAWVAQRDLAILLASEKAAHGGRLAIGGIVGIALFGIALVMLSIAGAYCWGKAVGDLASGFLYVGLIYIGVLSLFALVWRNGLGDRIALNIINAFHGDH